VEDTKTKDFKQNVIEVLKGEGYQIGYTKFRPAYFKRMGFSVKTVFDIGVCRGTPSLYSGFSDAKIVLIDPLKEARDVADRHGFDFIHCACGAEEENLQYAVPEGKLALTSLLDRTQLTDPKVKKEMRETAVRTLDSIVEEYNYQPGFGIKIDTEGYEMEVLRGASKTLEKADFVIAEVSVQKRFQDSYKFSEVIVHMAKNGFELLTILEYSNRFLDCMFVRSDSNLFEKNI